MTKMKLRQWLVPGLALFPLPHLSARFIRGDVDVNGGMDLTDPIRTLIREQAGS